MYKIREAKVEDFSMVAALSDDMDNSHIGMDPPMEKDYFNAVITANHIRMYVVEKSGLIAAFVIFSLNEGERSIFIDKFSIEKAYKKKGLDEHLYHKVEQLAEQKEFKLMAAGIQADDPDVYDFFERKGWRHDERVDRYYYVVK